MEILREQVKQAATNKVIVKFVNFSDEDFSYPKDYGAMFNSIPYSFKAGEVKFMEQGMAEVFAKHLVNRELLKDNRENDTSPKKKGDNPYFMALFNKCIFPVDMGAMDENKAEMETIDRNMKEKLGMKQKEAEFEDLPPPPDDED